MQKPEYQLIVGDCIQGMKGLPEKSVDVVVTSPPYNLGIKYGKYDDQRRWVDYLRWSMDWVTEVKRVLKDAGSFFLNLGACPSNPLIPHQLILEISQVLVLQNTMHWIKSITIETKAGEQVSAGHFKPIQSQRYVNDCHEFVFHLTKSGETVVDRRGVGVPYSDKSNIARWGHTGGQDLRCRGNTWFIPYQTIMSRSQERPHPATFPTELAVNCIRLHGCRPDLVMLDPFLGIGHAALAARQCGLRSFIGFDIDADYVAVAQSAVLNGSTRTAASPAGNRPLRRGRKKRPEAGPSLFDEGLLS